MENNFKNLSNMKEEAQKILEQTEEKYETSSESELETMKTRIVCLKSDIEYHTKKLVGYKQELERIVNKLEEDMAKALIPTNEPINIEPLTNSHV